MAIKGISQSVSMSACMCVDIRRITVAHNPHPPIHHRLFLYHSLSYSIEEHNFFSFVLFFSLYSTQKLSLLPPLHTLPSLSFSLYLSLYFFLDFSLHFFLSFFISLFLSFHNLIAHFCPLTPPKSIYCFSSSLLRDWKLFHQNFI